MKKILFFIPVILSLNVTAAMAGNITLTSDDFESYNTEAIYNSGSLTVSYPGMADATLTGAYIINAPGGIYGEDEAYEGNAAENIVTYAKTSDTTAVAVPGGLGNGWHGLYSHPMLYLEGGQGAASEYNSINRRLSVVPSGSGKVLKINPASNAYVSTASWYGYDEIDLSKPVNWTSDVNVQIIQEGIFEMSLTNGSFSESVPFQYVSHLSGRKSITPIVVFSGDGKILIEGEEAADYSNGVYYTVSVFIDMTSETPVRTVTITEKSSGNVVAEKSLMLEGFDFSGTVGVDYHATAPKGATKATEVFVDNVVIEQIVFDAEIKSSALVNINGKGRSLVEFSDVFVEDTINEDNIKVFCPDGTQLEGITLQIQKNKKQIVILYPELEASSDYTIVIKGVKSESGFVCDWRGSFTTNDIASFSAASKSGSGITFSLKNNSNNEAVLTVIAAGFNGGKIVSDGVYYRKVTLEGAKTTEFEISDMEFSETPEEIRIYAVDNIHNFKALVPQKSIK